MGIRIIKLPDVGEGVAEAELVEWHVEVGQSVLEYQILAAVMTDKATVEIPSPAWSWRWAAKSAARSPSAPSWCAWKCRAKAIRKWRPRRAKRRPLPPGRRPRPLRRRHPRPCRLRRRKPRRGRRWRRSCARRRGRPGRRARSRSPRPPCGGARATRASICAKCAAADRPRLTLMPFLMQAVVKAVADFPEMNALYDDEAETIERHGGVHIGVATQTEAGLMVPVVRHCEALGLWELAAEAQRLSEAARQGHATRAELTGSTITITSLGALGGIASTPVINRPEVAIIGVNKEVVRPVWQGAEFVPRTIMNLSSSFDHRVIDGYNAARFIQRIKGLIEAPATLFLEA